MCEPGEAVKSRTIEEEGGMVVSVGLRLARKEECGGGCPVGVEAFVATERRTKASGKVLTMDA